MTKQGNVFTTCISWKLRQGCVRFMGAIRKTEHIISSAAPMTYANGMHFPICTYTNKQVECVSGYCQGVIYVAFLSSAVSASWSKTQNCFATNYTCMLHCEDNCFYISPIIYLHSLLCEFLTKWLPSEYFKVIILLAVMILLGCPCPISGAWVQVWLLA